MANMLLRMPSEDPRKHEPFLGSERKYPSIENRILSRPWTDRHGIGGWWKLELAVVLVVVVVG